MVDFGQPELVTFVTGEKHIYTMFDAKLIAGLTMASQVLNLLKVALYTLSPILCCRAIWSNVKLSLSRLGYLPIILTTSVVSN